MVNETKLTSETEDRNRPLREPHGGWCGRTAGVTLPPTRFWTKRGTVCLLRCSFQSEFFELALNTNHITKKAVNYLQGSRKNFPFD